MKKLILTLIVIIIGVNIYCQEFSQDKSNIECKNIIGVDLYFLLSQLSLLNHESNYFESPYLINYKRKFNNNAIRFNIGGLIFNTFDGSIESGNNKHFDDELNIGIGYERYSYINKKWAYFYGVDAIRYYSRNGYNNTNGSYHDESTLKKYSYGISPLLGLIYQFNSRLSISSETSCDITYIITIEDEFNSKYPAEKSHKEINNMKTRYNSPARIIIRMLF